MSVHLGAQDSNATMCTPTSLSSNFLSSCVPLLIPHSWIYGTQGTGCPLRAQGEVGEKVGVRMVPTLMMNSMARAHDQLPQVTSGSHVHVLQRKDFKAIHVCISCYLLTKIK